MSIAINDPWIKSDQHLILSCVTKRAVLEMLLPNIHILYFVKSDISTPLSKLEQCKLLLNRPLPDNFTYRLIIHQIYFTDVEHKFI